MLHADRTGVVVETAAHRVGVAMCQVWHCLETVAAGDNAASQDYACWEVWPHLESVDHVGGQL